MSLYETSVKKPITTTLIFLGFAIVGLFSLTRLSIDLMPKTDPTRLMIITSYPGTSAEDIESNVSKTLENSLNSVGNLKHIYSTNREGISIITMEFNAGTDITEATNDIRDKLDAVNNALPEGINRPVIFKFGSDDIPVTIFTIRSKESFPALKKILENKVTNELARINGVGSVDIAGTKNRQIQVYCDPHKLSEYNLTIDQVGRIIAAENINISAGNIDIGSKTSSIRVEGEFNDPELLSNIAIANINTHVVYLRDIARIVDTSSEHEQEVYNNGERGAIIVIKKQSGANSVQISKDIKKILPKLESSLPSDIKMSYLIDTSDFIVSTINSLVETIVVTFIIVMLIVFIFLGGWKPTIIVIMTIPISLVGSFIYLMASGNSLNIISLSSLSIAIGMVVDDAIVVLENISSHIERGSYPKPAAIHGTNEVGISVIASTLTMLSVFLPLTMIQGQAGLMFRQLGWIISIVMIVSTVAALSLIPMLSSVFLKRNPRNTRIQELLFGAFNKMFSKFENWYSRVLNWSVRHRKTVMLSSLGIFIISFSCIPFIKTEFMPSVDNGFLQASIELPEGTNIDISRKFGLEIQSRWRKENSGINTIFMSVGQADASNSFASVRDNGTNIINYNIGLKDAIQRKKTAEEIADNMRNILKEYPNIKTSHITSAQSSGTTGVPTVDIDILGYDFDKTNNIAKTLKDQIASSKVCSEVKISRKDYVPEYIFVFDRNMLSEHGLNLATATSFLANNVKGKIVSFYREDGDEYQIRLSADPNSRKTLEDLLDYDVMTPTGAQIKLRNLGSFQESHIPPTIERKDRSRVVIVSSTVATGYALSDLVKVVQDVVSNTTFPSDVSYKIGGTYEDQQETSKELFTLMALIVVLVFIVMAAQFESITTPFVIMFSVPFAFTGVFLGLLITQIPLGVMALIGLIMLIGIVVKNGIVIIDYTRICQERGMGIISATVTAGKARIRPVLMTTLTTVFGMIPMAIGIGQGSEMWQSMGVTVAFGLSFSTIITLILIPTIYASFAGRDVKIERKRIHRKIYNKNK